MKSAYDFLTLEDQRWISRCRLVSCALFLGLVAAVALDSVEGRGAYGERWYASLPASVPWCQ